MHNLTSDDFRSATWRRLTQTLERRLELLRESNDDLSRDAVETAGIRGEIRAVKEILALGHRPSAMEGAQPALPAEQIVELHELGIDPTY